MYIEKYQNIHQPRAEKFLPAPNVQLRPSQKKVKQEVYQQILLGHKRIMVVAPCAWGKTIFASSIIADATTRNKKSLFVVHLDCLIEQTKEALELFGLNVGIIAGNYKENREADVQIGTYQALYSRSKKELDQWLKPDVTIIDECHDRSLWCTWSQRKFPVLFQDQIVQGVGNQFLLPYLNEIGLSVSSPTWNQILEARKQAVFKAHPDQGGKTEKMTAINLAWEEIRKHKKRFQEQGVDRKVYRLQAYDDCILIGLTGSPYRLKRHEDMSYFFQVQVNAPTPKEMIQEGYLTPCVYYGLPAIKTKGVKLNTKGDYQTKQLTTEAEKVIKDLYTNYDRICPDRTFIAFACSVRHAHKIAEEFHKNQVEVRIVTANTSSNLRKEYYCELEAKKIQGIVSVDCITTGFDVRSISCILLARPTKSKALYIQMLGRGMRLAEGKADCYVLDQTRNIEKYGFIESLLYPNLGESATDIEFASKTCPDCQRIVLKTIYTCPTCGHLFERHKKEDNSQAKEKTDKQEAVGSMVLKISAKDRLIYNYYREKIALYYKERRNPGKALYDTISHFKTKNIEIPVYIPPQWAKGAIFGNKPTSRQRIRYWQWLKNFAIQHKKDGSWVSQMYTLEFGSIAPKD